MLENLKNRFVLFKIFSFKLSSKGNAKVPCSQLADMDLSKWTE
jgi:hypothetical protein